jgi:hypothetical protein
VLRLRQGNRSLDRRVSCWTRFCLTMDLTVAKSDSRTLRLVTRPMYVVRARLFPPRMLFVVAGRGYGKSWPERVLSSYLATPPRKLSWESVQQSRRCVKVLLDSIQTSLMLPSLRQSIRRLAYVRVTASRTSSPTSGRYDSEGYSSNGSRPSTQLWTHKRRLPTQLPNSKHDEGPSR